MLAFEKLMDEHGKPMHKSLGNAIWFDEAAEQMGADLMRWLYCAQNVQSNLNFGFGPAEEVKRRLLVALERLQLLRHLRPHRRLRPEGRRPAAGRALAAGPLDRLAPQQRRRRASRAAWTGSTPPRPTRVVERFVDDLSTWYVRRSRRRFWKAADDADKRAAQATLYEVLTHADAAAGAVPAVRLGVDLPEPGPRRSTRRRRRASTTPRTPRSIGSPSTPIWSARSRSPGGWSASAAPPASRRRSSVRQPLALARVGAPADAPALRDELREEIERELNVERLEVGGDVGDAVEHVVQAKPALIGPRLGRKVQDVLKALRAGEQTVRPGRLGGGGRRGARRPKRSPSAPARGPASPRPRLTGTPLVLDTRLTPELLQAGLARELVHRIQTMRKDAGFEVEDRIVTRFDADGELAGVFAAFGEYIKQETLSVALEPNGGGGGHAWSGQIEGRAGDDPGRAAPAARRDRELVLVLRRRARPSSRPASCRGGR